MVTAAERLAPRAVQDRRAGPGDAVEGEHTQRTSRHIDAIALKAKLYDKNTAKFKWLKEACLAFARRFCSATTVGLNQRLRPTEMRKRVKEMGLSRASSATGARKQSTSERRRIANSSAEEQAAEAKRQELEQVRGALLPVS